MGAWLSGLKRHHSPTVHVHVHFPRVAVRSMAFLFMLSKYSHHPPSHIISIAMLSFADPHSHSWILFFDVLNYLSPSSPVQAI